MAVAAIIALVVFGVLPRIGAPTTLSASEVLGRSLQTLSSTRGVEWVQYELVVEGIAQGAWRIEQLIDHDLPTRYRVAAFREDGVVHSALSQDPRRGQRSQLVRVDGRNYIVKVDALQSPMLSLPQMGQALVETVITMMQATSDQHLAVVGGAAGSQYVIEIPPVAPTDAAANARALPRSHCRGCGRLSYPGVCRVGRVAPAAVYRIVQAAAALHSAGQRSVRE